MNEIDVYRITLIAAALTGLVFTWRSIANPLLYFTVQSTLMVVAYNLWQVSGVGEPSGTVGGGLSLFATITFLVAHFLLGGGASPLRLLPTGHGNAIRNLGELLLHYVVPVMTVLDWFLFDRALDPDWTAPVLWLAYPVAYLIFALVRGALLAPGRELRYPYPFLDAGRLGYHRVALQAVVLTVSFALLGHLLVALHRLAPW